MSWTGQAEVLADTQELGNEAGIMAGRCQATGLDPRSFRGIIGASLALGSGPAHSLGVRWASDRELITAICDLLDLIADRWTAYRALLVAAANARAFARALLAGAPDDLGAGYQRAVIADCTTALDILGSLAARLRAASSRLNAAPHELGETYAAVYALIAQGRRMPHNGRWITGEEPS